MAYIKTFTDLSQSKKLAEFLPVESADLCYFTTDGRGIEYVEVPEVIEGLLEDDDVPCWSLAALLSFLPYPYIEQNFRGKWTCKVEQRNIIFLREASNPIDAVVELILELKEKNLIN